MAIITEPALLRLLQLSSSTLPVGGYAFSQGMESAVEAGWLPDAQATSHWLQQQLLYSLARVDIPLLLRLHRTIGNGESVDYFNAYVLACRETAELRQTDTAMGQALTKLLTVLEVPMPITAKGQTSFVTAFAAAASHWQISERSCCYGFLWSWLENQVAAATKLVPLGQTAAQTLLGELMPVIEETIEIGVTVTDEDIGASLPALALSSCQHEHQYSRLFRS
jgi:urease accessory protein